MKRRNRPGDDPGAATSTTPIATAESNRCSDNQIDLTLLGGPDADVWAALFDGRFRLAVPCSR